MEVILHYFENFTPEFLYIETGILIILLLILSFIWVYNRKRYNSLKHQIPAGVVKNYLDSIIQNSSSLKSSLFRGGAQDLGIPSVMPISNLPGGDSIEISTGGADVEVQKKNAQLASIQGKLNEKNNIIKELENRLANMPTGDSTVDDSALKDLQAQLAEALAEIERLKNMKSDAPVEGAITEEVHNNLKEEKEALEEKLKEYEVIEDDLANLKRLKQENEQLKKSLGQQSEASETVGGGDDSEEETTLVSGGSEADEATTISGGSEGDDETTLVSGGSNEDDSVTVVSGGSDEDGIDTKLEADAPSESSADAPQTDEEKKTPEDLLSEFEKMLG